MDYQILIQLMTSRTFMIKKVTPFLLSVSVFSFIFSNSYWHSFLFRSFKFYFSSLPLQVLNHALDKSWIFLICNGILVLIANTSGGVHMVHSPSGFDLNDLLQKKIDDGLQAPLESSMKDASLEVSESENAVPEVEGEEKENGVTEEGQQENSCLVLDDDEDLEQESQFPETGGGDEDGAETQELQIACIMGDEELDSETWSMTEEEDYQEQLYDNEREGIDKLSTEELNKKFDDFIRKMKEELRIEAQQQLVLVK